MGKRKKEDKHYCWACDQRLANEKFSGKGHAKHICKTCAKLDAEELAYRQDVRNLMSCVTTEFEHFLQHENPLIRAPAEEIQQIQPKIRELTPMKCKAPKLVADDDGNDDIEYPF